MCLLKMVKESKEFDFHFEFIDSGYTIAENRNFLAAKSVQNECDYLLMVDDDMIFPPETLRLLVSRKKDIIGLPYNVKVAYKEGDGKRRLNNVTYYPDKEIPEVGPVEVLAIGGGVMLVKTEIFKKLLQPHFNFDQYPNGMTKVGEDSWFCYKASKAGYKVWCEMGVEGIAHIGDFLY